ncbi:hypothetical protein VTK26DRAFT_7512 [Humicola hyalothermophila]
MMRPTTLFRALLAPSRQILPQPAPASILTTFSSRRFLAATPPTTASSSAATSSAIPPSSSSSPTQSARTATPPPTPPTESAGRPPYLVTRTASNNFRVYHLAKRGGNKKLTVIKKVEGDRQALRSMLSQHLKVAEHAIKVNSLTGHVTVPGHRKQEVTDWLAAMGF